MTGRLSGRVVAVTRDGDPDDPLVARIGAAGGRVVVWPTLAFDAPEDPGPLDEALADPGRWDWIVFTSARAVEAVAERGMDLAGLKARVATVGRATEAAVRERGGRVAVVGDAGGEALAGAMAAADLDGARILFPAASRASDRLSDGLGPTGARVVRVEAYRTVLTPPDGARVRADLATGVDAVTFASPSAVTALDRALDGSLGSTLGTRPAVTIGPTTAAAVREAGVTRVEVAPETSLSGLVQAVIHALEEHPR